MTAFNKWWESRDNPAQSMPASTRDQIKDFMRTAFAAGVKSERNKRVIRDAEFIQARRMFKGVPEI